MNNLMTEPMIRVGTTTGEVIKQTLPGVLAGLVRDEVVAFAALQPHQSHAWHAFLVQLSAIALHRSGQPAPPPEEAAWRELLRALTADWPEDEPWQLVVSDLTKPAFMQPPVPENTLAGFKNQFFQPDRIDVLVTAKNHDVKMARMGHAHPDHWLMALVSLQGMEGFLGAGNYGIARMNGGFASRPGVGIRPGPAPGSHFRQDLALLQRYRRELLDNYPDFYKQSSGIALLWLLPWDGQTSLSLAELDPYFIEVCRRMRLLAEPGGITACGTTSKAARIQAKEFKGVLGDPWTPLRADTSLTITDKGFDYTLVVNLILGSEEYRPAPAQSHASNAHSGEMEFLARGLTRGQGQTGGYHERRVPIPARVGFVLGQPKARESLAHVARNRVEQCGVLASKVLKPALLAMIQEAPDKLNFKDRRADPWLTRLDHKVDDLFFPSLWHSLELGAAEAEADWLRVVRDAAREILEAAKKSLIGGGARRYKTFAAADRLFYGSLCKQFPLFRTHERPLTDEEKMNG
ncbi:MAG: type I-E CRISPR-associated protein Cse1/CasA [Magnetococcus sp. YQC-3]